MKNLSINTLVVVLSLGLTGTFAERTYAGVSVSPFVSVSSKKTVKPGASKKETETTKQRTTYGIKAKVSFFRLLGAEASIGTNKLETTQKTSELVDDFEEIDLKKELKVDVDDPDKEVKVTEEQRKATASLVFDPSFSIFILRAKAGVLATQRLFEKEEVGAEKETYVSPITYKPIAGVGAGVKLGRMAFFMAEYSFNFYKFPETEPFERELTVSFGVSL